MMVILSHDAQLLRDRYLRQVRASLRGHTSVDVDDVERDVQGHIDAALAGKPEPIDVGSLREILDRLGAPQEWAPTDDLPSWRRLLSRLWRGPEDWRLPYLSFISLFAGVTLFLLPSGNMTFWPLPIVLPLASFMLARATLSVLAAHDESVDTRRWLIFPSLLVVYVPLSLVLFAWPVPIVLGANNDMPLVHDWISRISEESFGVNLALTALFAAGVWWVLLGLLLMRFRKAAQAVFWPMAEWLERKHAIGVSAAGVILAAVAAFILAAVRS
jgi:hypothetical protein